MKEFCFISTMKPHTCYPLQFESSDIVEVTLSGWANVILLDDINYRNYRKRKRFAYTGDLRKHPPSACRRREAVNGT